MAKVYGKESLEYQKYDTNYYQTRLLMEKNQKSACYDSGVINWCQIFDIQNISDVYKNKIIE